MPTEETPVEAITIDEESTPKPTFKERASAVLNSGLTNAKRFALPAIGVAIGALAVAVANTNERVDELEDYVYPELDDDEPTQLDGIDTPEIEIEA